ncbi:hypothetical protein JAAARDRAFT_116379 [Jaapia argillacea MUCL 33604]|uniref:Uncharacterized protein n=1 Tax=Jaapia argillacea MUCL 33604 TaxID=933084 RepID=A0A067QAX8_9AGAM|nr:hypothetical protein JAAARDRAFT_116379 [Jaapia argillacea MUCL 33604]
MSNAANIFGYVAGGVSLGVLALGLYGSHRPSARQKNLDEVISDTETILRSATHQGFLPDPHLNVKLHGRLSGLRAKASELRTKTLCATSTWKECREFCLGLSFEIGNCTNETKKLRAVILVGPYRLSGNSQDE